jgi:hypothetical protein
VAVKGNLRDISLTSLISINCNEMSQARLSVTKQGKQASVFFDEGNIVHAELDSMEGEEAIYKLLQWEEGEFDLENGIPAPKQTIHTPWSSVLLHGMHRKDEENAGLDMDTQLKSKDFTQAENAGKILAAIQRVDGVNAAFLCHKKGGQIISEDAGGWPVLAPFLMQHGGRMAESLDQRGMDFILLSDGKSRVMIVPYDPGLLVILGAKHASFDSVLKTVKQLQERYPLHPQG